MDPDGAKRPCQTCKPLSVLVRQGDRLAVSVSCKEASTKLPRREGYLKQATGCFHSPLPDQRAGPSRSTLEHPGETLTASKPRDCPSLAPKQVSALGLLSPSVSWHHTQQLTGRLSSINSRPSRCSHIIISFRCIPQCTFRGLALHVGPKLAQVGSVFHACPQWH